MGSSGVGRDVHSSTFVHPAFPLPITAASALQGALKGGFGEALVARDMPEPCEFPSLDSLQKRVFWAQTDENRGLSNPHHLLNWPSRIEKTG